MIWDAEDLEWPLSGRDALVLMLLAVLCLQMAGALTGAWFGAGYLRC